eukprot:6779062-Prorocentrum_lima.AAC.1
MTSSLVGSEMCIRDSGQCVVGIHFLFDPHRHGCPRFSCCGRSTRPQSVSYTHLTLPTICSV